MNPYKDIWFNTGKTIESVIQGSSKYNYTIPLVIAGLSVSIGEIGQVDNLIFKLAAPIGSVLWVFLFYILILPWLFRKIGKLWKGKASIPHLRIVLSLSLIPFFMLLFFQLLSIVFNRPYELDQVPGGIGLIASIFSFRILIIGLAKIQQFGYGLAIVNWVLVMLPIAAAVMIFQ